MKPPEPKLPFTLDDFRGCWPMKASKVELDDGHPLFDGEFDEEDANIAKRAFPGRPVTIDGAGNMTLHASGCTEETCQWWP